MKELQHVTIVLSDEHKGKARIINADNESENVLVDVNYSNKTGDTRIEIDLEIFKRKRQPLPVELFERELNVTEKQRIELYEDWGHTKAIMIKDVALRLAIERDEAIKIVNLACTYGLLTRGHNNTWKVVSDVIQARWIEEGKRLRRGPEKEVETVEESIQKSLSRYAEQAKKLGLKGFENHAKEEEGMVANRSMIEKHEMQHEETVEIVPELPLKKVSKIGLEVMKQDVKDIEELKEQMRSGIVAETIDCNEHMLNDKIKTLKVQIANAEITQSQGQYTQGVKITASGSITKVERVEQREVQKKESDTFHVSQKKIPTKGKPSSRSPVVKKK
jgi:hypothetical protein